MLIARFLRDRRGNISLLAVIMLPAAIIGVGAAVDFAGLAADKGKLQATADAAAVTAARSLFTTWGKLPRTARESQARTEALAVVEGTMPSSQATVETSTFEHIVSIQLSRTKALDFGGVLGQQTATVQTVIKAAYLDPEAACVIALGPSESPGIELASQATIDAPRCGVWSNSTSRDSIRLRGSTELRGRKICAVGEVAATGGTDFFPAPKTHCGTFPDPYEGVAVSSNDPCGPAVPPNPSRLYPQVYCGGLSISGSVTMEPGLYEIRNGPLTISGNGSIQGTGVSILLSGAAAVLDISSNPTITLSAMTSGPLKGIVIASAPPASPIGSLTGGGNVSVQGTGVSIPILTSQIHGSPTVNLTGSVYLPNQRLDLDGGMRLNFLGPKNKLVALSLSLGPGGGSPRVTVNADDSRDFSPTGAIRLLQ